MKTINRTKAKELIKESKGLIFSTTYIKKDNTVRTLTSRTGKQYTPTGNKATYIPVPNMDTCEVMASVIVGVIKYKCVYVTDGDDA